MVIAHHVIFGAYGFWLPNDPRGSWSDFVGSWELSHYGKATTTNATLSLAKQTHDHSLRTAAKKALKHQPVSFSGIQARAIGCGFARYASRSRLAVLACAILPEHIHLVLARHHLSVESVVIQLKGEATRSLIAERVHPFGTCSENKRRRAKCFARGLWKVFLDTPEDVVRAIRYVENNPLKEGKNLQRWSFVIPWVPV